MSRTLEAPRRALPEQHRMAAENPAGSTAGRISLLAASAPGHAAAIDDAACLTFAELEIRSNDLAAYLREAGAGPDRCVGLFLERSADFIVAALAVLKTGAAYLPLDASAPADRAAFILADAGAPLLLTHRQKTKNWATGPWRIMEMETLGTTRPAPFAPIDPDPESLAYIIYTSGSTGRPKGVEVTHANLLNLIDWHQAAFAVTAADRASQVAGLGFDAAGWEIWPSLTAGATIHFADELTRRSPQNLRDWLVAHKITISFVPTVLAEQLLHTPWPAETALRVFLTGADTLHRRPAAGLPFVLVNNYGPTECCVVTTSGTITPDADIDGPPSIGRPIANATVLILDDALNPVAAGEPGELCIAGALVARGYRNRPELTASRFVTYSSPSGPPMRIYRTGDRARLLPTGEIAFLGRMDDQVKIRGYRVELGEIVASLDRYPGIEASAVTVRDGPDAASGPMLIAYLVPARDAKLNASDLREFLSPRLPDYMIPSHYVTLSALPITPNGKLDKSSLPAPSAENLLPGRPSAASPVAPVPTSDIQSQIAAMVASLLAQPSVPPDENFFMIGGHSMFGVQLVARLRDMFGIKLTLRQLFNAPTIAALSAEVERLGGKPQ